MLQPFYYFIFALNKHRLGRSLSRPNMRRRGKMLYGAVGATRHIRGWNIEIENVQKENKYTLVKIQGRIAHSQNLREAVNKIFSQIPKEEERVVFDFGEVSYVSTAFLGYLSHWVKERIKGENFMGITRVTESVKEILACLGSLKHLKQLPAVTSQWGTLIRDKSIDCFRPN